jgi:hypothetical protein
MIKSKAESSKDYRNRLMLKGLCVRGCGGEPVTEGGICEACRLKVARWAAEAKRKFRLTNPPLPRGSKPGVKRGPYKPRLVEHPWKFKD